LEDALTEPRDGRKLHLEDAREKKGEAGGEKKKEEKHAREKLKKIKTPFLTKHNSTKI